jgi:UDP-2,4-diacetamido-2,4,6-trideoxy-beta-L-altropyranose hydrolase
MKVFFRVDANKEIGSGHLTRCANLALVFKEMGAECTFIVNKKSFLHFSHLPSLNYEFISVNNLEEDAAETAAIIKKEDSPYLVLDSYLHDWSWETKLKGYAKKVLVWDDLANRKHDCDILVDCGLQRSKEDYKNLVGSETVLLVGPQYCPISSELKKIKNEEKNLTRIHLFFGSLDSGNTVMNYFEEIIRIVPGYSINIAIANTPDDSILTRWNKSKRKDDQLFVGRPIGESLQDCQLAIGAPGVTTWERAYLGIFGFYIATNVNQISILKELEKLEICHYVGSIEDAIHNNVQKVAVEIKSINIKKAFEKCKNFIDGLGLERIVKEVLQ